VNYIDEGIIELIPIRVTPSVKWWLAGDEVRHMEFINICGVECHAPALGESVGIVGRENVASNSEGILLLAPAFIPVDSKWRCFHT
jgi:hypothetical protein